jgi:hypothetical protein
MVQQKSLLQKMEEAIGLINLLQQEKDDATARANAMESENREIKALLTLAESKADEMLAVRGTSPKDESKPKLNVPEPKETPAAVSFKSPAKEPERTTVESTAEESDTVPSMDQRTPAPREPAATDAGESQKKPSEDQSKSWADLRERFRRPLSTS